MIQDVRSSSDGEYPKRLIDVGAVARILSVSTRTVWRLHSKGEIPRALAIGSSKRWTVQSIVDYIDSKQQGK